MRLLDSKFYTRIRQIAVQEGAVVEVNPKFPTKPMTHKTNEVISFSLTQNNKTLREVKIDAIEKSKCTLQVMDSWYNISAVDKTSSCPGHNFGPFITVTS